MRGFTRFILTAMAIFLLICFVASWIGDRSGPSFESVADGKTQLTVKDAQAVGVVQEAGVVNQNFNIPESANPNPGETIRRIVGEYVDAKTERLRDEKQIAANERIEKERIAAQERTEKERIGAEERTAKFEAILEQSGLSFRSVGIFGCIVVILIAIWLIFGRRR